MRILHVLSSLDRRAGGTSTATIGLAMAQAAAGLDVSMLATYGPRDETTAADDLARGNVAITLVGPTRGRLLARHEQTPTRLRQLIAAADVVHVHGLWEDVQYQAMRIARRAAKPYVVTAHGMLSPWALAQKALKKRLYLALRLRRPLQRAARLHFATPEEARQAQSLGLRPRPLIEPHGLDLHEFADLPERGTFRRRFPTLGDHPIVMFMGRLHPVKGLDLLIPAFAAAATNDARLVLAGPDEGGYETVLRSLIRHHGLSERVMFAGMLYGPDRVAALTDADLFVLPSYMENFGIVALEALAARTPVLLSDQVNFCDHVRDQPFARVVPCEAPALAAGLSQWLSDPAALGKAALQARPWAMERFQWAAIARNWHDHYRDIVAST